MYYMAYPGLMYLFNEFILSLNKYTYNVQSFIGVILVNTTKKLLNFAPKLGLAW